ncbi:tetratricopeptide repeat protein [Bradyrhizobium sp. LMTR 3]|uniref:tetratricopeptide repeat protein n=1 Tax=Bradyrhizobium sp. LMTR 3 TaxID=189873 RepID=UPI0032E3A536
MLRAAIETSPQDAGLHHALGFALVRAKRSDEALRELRRASELDPAQARYAYVYAIALDSAGRRKDVDDSLRR